MTAPIAWHGTHREQLDLLTALSRHCACEIRPGEVRVQVCPAHRMLIEDQRILDRLLFARHLARRLKAEEQHAA